MKGRIGIGSRNSRCKIKAVDLFCGVGGLTRGMEKAGIDVTLGIDVDPACEYPYVANNRARFLLKSVETISASDLFESYEGCDFKLLAGCAPCQTFSTYNQRADSNDKRWWLLQHFGRLIDELSPELVTMENVPGLVKHKVFSEFVDNLENNDYWIGHQIVRCEEYGLPQQRKRLVLLASKLGPIGLPSPRDLGRKRKTVRDIIGGTTPLASGQIDEKDPLHQCSFLSDTNLKRIRASAPGGTWRDWPEDLVADCHRKKTGKTYPGVYGRMRWDEPSPTITTQFYGYGNGRFGHPEQDRAISLREGAMLQGFPKKYRFVEQRGPINKKLLGRLIGNAVPVKLSEIIGKCIIKHVGEHYG